MGRGASYVGTLLLEAFGTVPTDPALDAGTLVVGAIAVDRLCLDVAAVSIELTLSTPPCDWILARLAMRNLDTLTRAVTAHPAVIAFALEIRALWTTLLCDEDVALLSGEVTDHGFIVVAFFTDWTKGIGPGKL